MKTFLKKIYCAVTVCAEAEMIIHSCYAYLMLSVQRIYPVDCVSLRLSLQFLVKEGGCELSVEKLTGNVDQDDSSCQEGSVSLGLKAEHLQLPCV